MVFEVVDIVVPKLAKSLTVKQVEAFKEPGRYSVGGVAGLHLVVTESGKSWILRAQVGSRRTDIGLGSFSDVGLARAREEARRIRQKIYDGVDPVLEKRNARATLMVEQAKTMTFAECASTYIESHKAGWKSEKHAKQWSATLGTYAYPIIGKLPVSGIETAHIRNVLYPIWNSKTETASRLRGRIESVLDWAKVNGYRDGENPARWRGHLDQLLPKRSKVQRVKHFAALPYAELGSFMAELREREGMSARALEFAILTAARSGEVRQATWSEIDFNNTMWIVSAERMKAGKEHRVPLSDDVIELLSDLPRFKDSDYLFPAARGGALSNMAMTSVLKRMGRKGLTQHGFRSTFRDWAGETTAYPREVIEHALAHKLKDKAEAAYQRGDMFIKRAKLMKDWALYCRTTQQFDAKVIAIGRQPT